VSESLLQDRVRLILGADSACVFWRNNVGVATTERGTKIKFGLFPGSADLIGVFRGRFVGIELKTPIGRQTPEQKKWQACLEAHGGIYAIVRSEDEARALLADLHRRFPPTEAA
jgi:hypothetical protein